jgi:ribosome small subunit-dependent GTPase A
MPDNASNESAPDDPSPDESASDGSADRPDHRTRRRRGSAHNLADRYRFGEFDNQDATADSAPDEPPGQRFTSRSKHAQQNKILKTATARAAEPADIADLAALPIGEVRQVYSLFCEVTHGGQRILCVVRKTLSRVSDTAVVVGDRVRFRETTTAASDHSSSVDPAAPPPPREGVIEQILPRQTVLTRTDSFKSHKQHPIVANAQQMLIVASAKLPEVKWGLIDRMLAAARSGGLLPIVCLNKIDLLDAAERADESTEALLAPLRHYALLGIPTVQTTIHEPRGLAVLRDLLQNHITVLAGHSGVGKSSLINAIEPALDLRVGAVSDYTAKGRHTTTSARHYDLSFGGAVIDTPGVKHFGLWGVTRETLVDFFPDIADKTAPPWRVESYARIAESLEK